MIKRFTMTVLILMLLLSAVSLFAGDDAVVAKIGDMKIMRSDFKRMTDYYDADKQKALEQKPQMKQNLLKLFVQTYVISKLARDKGFDREPGVKEQLEMLLNNFLSTEYIRKEIISKIMVTEKDMEAYYKVNKDAFKTPELVSARHILIKAYQTASAEEKAKAREKAETLLKRIKAGEDFVKLAEEFSDDAGSKAKGGDLGFSARGRLVPAFEQAAFSLKPGELSGIVETDFGYHIIRVDERKESVHEPFDKVKDKVYEKLFAEFKSGRVSDFMDKALKDAGAEIYFEALEPKK